ncbi:energy transducer TonB, partial [Fretibacterium sp. OH1220_COT-178]|uniref:energy transducer TonB n=1 Tax=Fretibacterium sp. OH1220_COT-178 TaxID=2491047 RepID=UPI0018F57162
GTGPVDVGTLKILSKTPPEYPLFSRRRREEGKLTILITIESGRVVDAVVENGSGHARLDEAALKAVRTWRFDHAGRIRARVPVSFRLER